MKLNKVRPQVETKDICQDSLDLLESIIGVWFEGQGIPRANLWFADQESSCIGRRFPKSSQNVEVILSGNFLYRILEIPLWPFENFRIWVLSERIREILVELFHFAKEKIGVVPAAELNSPELAAYQLRSKPGFGLPKKWIYAGRLSPGKNILGLLMTVQNLQLIHNLDVSLEFYGEFDEEPDSSFGRYRAFNHQQAIEKFLLDSPWKIKPEFKSKVPQFNWLKAGDENSAVVSFSTHMAEDFGTATWMAQKVGFLCLLSDWGGHSNLSSEYQLRIPSRIIPLTYDNEGLRELKSKVLAQVLSGNLESLRTLQGARVQNKSPEIFSKSEAESKLQNFLAKYLPEALMISRHLLDRFADTEKGRKFFDTYRGIMSGNQQAEELVVIGDQSQLTPEKLLLNGLQKSEFLRAHEVTRPYHWRRLNEYSKIQFLQKSDSTEKLKSLMKIYLGERFEQVLRGSDV